MRADHVSTIALAAMMAFPSAAFAQDGAPPQTGDASNEIVVTAQKREERLQDVPLSVTALGGNALANRQINDTSSLTQAVPSLTFQQGTNASNTSFRLRGVGTSLFGQGVESAVSVVVDGVVAARQAQGFSDFADIERIEVLRGPQGTLFGRNATAGVINVVTARPSKIFEVRGDATIAEKNEYRAKGTVSGPLTDNLRARVTGYFNHVGGITENVTTGKMVNGSEGWGIRGKLEWQPAYNLDLLLSADYRKSNSDCCAQVLISAVNPAVAQLNAPVVGSRTNRQNSDEALTYGNSHQKTFSLQGELDLGSATLTSITAYQDYFLDTNQSADRIKSDPVPYVGNFAYASWPIGGGNIDLSNFTQEVRISSNGTRDLTYVVGAYYSSLSVGRDYTRRRATCASGVLGQPCAVAPVWQSSFSNADLDSSSIAAFGQVEYRVIGGLKALGGLRVQREKISVSGSRVTPFYTGDTALPGNAPVSGKRSASDTAVTGRAGLQYEFSRSAQIYGSYTRGYKGPGFDTEIGTDFAAQNVVEPEHVNAYEIGFKGQTADRKLNFSVAFFLADYSNLQVQANRSDPTTGITQFVTTNAGSSQTKGFEIEATARPVSGLSINGSLTYTKTSVDVDGLNCPLQFQAAAQTYTSNFPANICYKRQSTVNGATVVSSPLQDVHGGNLPAAPRVRFTVTPRYETDIAGTDWKGFVQAAASYTSRQNFSLEQDPLLEQPGYTLVDLSVGAQSIDGRYSLTLFVKNLFDKNYLTSMAHNSLLANTTNPYDIIGNYSKDADRYFGATLGFRF